MTPKSRAPCAGPRGVSLLATFPAAPASVRTLTVRRHMSKTKAAGVARPYHNYVI